MLKAARISALILLLACSARAGVMQNETPAPPPPSQPANYTQEPTDTLQEPTANDYMQNGAPSSLTQIALEVLAVLPSLL
jgi:hypothetical protein